MTRSKTIFSDIQSKVMLWIFEHPLPRPDNYVITQQLNADLSAGTPQYKAAFDGVITATKDLILKNLVQGERQRGADGVY